MLAKGKERVKQSVKNNGNHGGTHQDVKRGPKASSVLG